MQLSLAMVVSNEGATMFLSGDLDMEAAPRVFRAIEQLPPCDWLVVDLRRLSFLDSTGLACLLALSGGAMVVRFIAGPANVQRIFDITATTALLDWVEAPLVPDD